MSESDHSTPARRPLPDVRVIDLDDGRELEYWLKFFDTTQDRLLAAISEVGPYAGPVADLLKKSR